MQIDSHLLRQCWFLAGPTASGKTATAIALANAMQGEILSLDSMAIYRRMDIGTAKPDAKEQSLARHHLIDLIEPWEVFSTADYMDAANEAIQQIIGRGKVPIFAGGTGLYLRSLLRGVFPGPPADQAIRDELKELPPHELNRQLQQCDPQSAQRLHVNDQRRRIRALEVYRLTGEPISAWQQEEPLPQQERPQHVYWISPPRDWLHERINTRVDVMVEQGLFAEVQSLRDHPQGLSHTAAQALGYKEVIEHLEGNCSAEDAIEQVKTRTRQFAKRQCTWFRNMEECRELCIEGNETAEQLVQQLRQQ